ncbi:hypothetical protein COK35_27185 [Bacillus cereus]|nr:hypothetical protein COK35_27185 [Bacillus cereus]
MAIFNKYHGIIWIKLCGELMIAVSLGITAIVNGLLLLALQVVRVIVAKGKNSIEFRCSIFLCIKKSLFMRDFNVVRISIDKQTKFQIHIQVGEQHGTYLLPLS